MKAIFFSTLLFSIISISLFAQAPVPSWQQIDGTYGVFHSVIPTSDGGMLAVGWTLGPQHSPDSLDEEGYHYSSNGYYEEAWLVKRSSTGALEWGHCYGGTNGNSEALTACKSSDGGYVIGGWSEASNEDVPSNIGYEDAWYFKVDSIGNLVWKKSFGTYTGYEQVNGITPTMDGDYIVSGRYYVYRDLIMKLNADGDTIWTHSYAPTNYEGYAQKSIQLSDGGFMIAESLYDFFGLDNLYFTLTRINSIGSLMWQKTVHIDSSVEQSLCDFVRCSDGGYALSGYAQGVVDNVVYFPEIFVMRCDSGGNFQWEKTYGTSGYDFGYGIVEDEDANLIIGGYVETADTTFPQHNSQAFLLKLNNNDGSEIWFQVYPTQPYSFNDGLSSFQGLVKTSTGAMVAAGQYNCGHGYSLDSLCVNSGIINGYMAMFPALGSGINNVSEQSSDINIYPDPVAYEISLKLNRAEVFPMNVSVINEEGQEVISGKIISAQQKINVQALPSGIYLFQLKNDRTGTVSIPFIKQ